LKRNTKNEPTGDDDEIDDTDEGYESVGGNKRARLEAIMARDGATCVWCRCAIDTGTTHATSEHLVPRIKGGPSWFENELGSCPRCNRERGHRTLTEFVDECRDAGRDPDVARLVAGLERFEQAYLKRGGARKCRPYVESQLRRLRRV